MEEKEIKDIAKKLEKPYINSHVADAIDNIYIKGENDRDRYTAPVRRASKITFRTFSKKANELNVPIGTQNFQKVNSILAYDEDIKNKIIKLGTEKLNSKYDYTIESAKDSMERVLSASYFARR